VFSGYILLLTLFLPNTPRWLMRHDGNVEKGVEVLARLRGEGVGDVDVLRERGEILEAIEGEGKGEAGWELFT